MTGFTLFPPWPGLDWVFVEPVEEIEMTRTFVIALIAMLSVSPAWAGNDTVKAAVGGGVGGAAGAAIGAEVGGRDGAIIGGAIGGAVGAAIATSDKDGNRKDAAPVPVEVKVGTPARPAAFCPPGLAKQGRC
jgi:hypothetical protein